jgi:hypothetical protein
LGSRVAEPNDQPFSRDRRLVAAKFHWWTGPIGRQRLLA